jgi:5-methylcytosine-specific restriction endonuclease McrA
MILLPSNGNFIYSYDNVLIDEDITMPIPKDPEKAKLWKERQSASKKGHNPYIRTPEHKEKMKLIFIGRKFSPEHCKHISDAKRGKAPPCARYKRFGSNNPFFGKRHSSETIQRAKNDMRTRHYGVANSRWRGGITSEYNKERHSFLSREWRNKVFNRDGFTCQKCGDNKGGNLRAHHLLPWRYYPDYRYCMDNGITLCNKCHDEIHKRKVESCLFPVLK